MLVELMSVVAVMAADVPTNGQLMREIRTDQEAFDLADENGDGRISNFEFESYKRMRRSQSVASVSYRSRLGGVDGNGDGGVTPCELYAEADCPQRPRKKLTSAQKDCTRTDGYYHVDDRNGAVYCPSY